MRFARLSSAFAFVCDALLFPLLAVIAVLGAAVLVVAFLLAVVAWGFFTVLRDLMSWRGRQ